MSYIYSIEGKREIESEREKWEKIEKKRERERNENDKREKIEKKRERREFWIHLNNIRKFHGKREERKEREKREQEFWN